MKRLLILFSLVLTTITGSISQVSNFIEITVDDTVKLKAVKIRYLITENVYNTEYTYETNDTKREENKRVPESVLDETEKKLKTSKYTYSRYTESKNYRISNADYYDSDKSKNSYGLLVELNNVKELEDLYNLLHNEKGIDGKIMDVAFESKDLYNDILLKHLVLKAQKEAEILASITGLKLGKIISISEAGSTNSYSIMDWYKDILSLGKFEDGLFGRDLTSIYTRKLTFKFTVE